MAAQQKTNSSKSEASQAQQQQSEHKREPAKPSNASSILSGIQDEFDVLGAFLRSKQAGVNELRKTSGNSSQK